MRKPGARRTNCCKVTKVAPRWGNDSPAVWHSRLRAPNIVAGPQICPISSQSTSSYQGKCIFGQYRFRLLCRCIEMVIYARTDLCKTHYERWIEVSCKEAEKKRDAKRDTKQLARLIAYSSYRPAWQHEYHGTYTEIIQKLGVEQQTNSWVDLVTMSYYWLANETQFWVVKTIIWPCWYL